MPKRVEAPDRRELFAREYVIDLNGTRAAIAAGYSPNGANSKAAQLLATVRVQKRVEELLAKRASKLEIKADRVLEELAKLAFLDPRKFYREDGSLRQVTELDDDTAACLAGIEHEKLYEHYAKGQASEIGTTTKIKFHDKGQNLERLGRHLKLFTEKVEISADDEMVERLIAGRKRLNQLNEGGKSES